MSATIQSQTTLVHADSGLTAASVNQRTSVESAFSSSSIAVTTTPEAIALGDVVVPRQILLKLTSGSDVLVSTDGSGGDYFMSLSAAGDSMLINLDSRTTSAITCVADVAGSLGGKYFVIYDLAGPVWVWLDTGNGDGVAATGLLTSNGVNVANGETVTIGSKTFTFQTTLTDVDGNVLIGVDSVESLTNLFNAINGSGGTIGTDYAASTVAHTQVTATNDTATTVELEAIVVGTAANSYATTDTSAQLLFSAVTLTGGVNSSIEPTVTTERLLPVVISPGATADAVADAVAAALDADDSFICANPAAATLSIVDAGQGARTTITAGTSTFTSPSANTTTPPTVYIKSLITSQVVVAVAPA